MTPTLTRRECFGAAVGAAIASLLAAEMLATTDAALYERLVAWRAARTQEVMEQELPA